MFEIKKIKIEQFEFLVTVSLFGSKVCNQLIEQIKIFNHREIWRVFIEIYDDYRNIVKIIIEIPVY